MKKIYLTLAAAAIVLQANAQFWTYTSYQGAFPVTDGTTGTTSNDWTAGWANFDPQNASYGATTVTVNSDITTNTTWTTGTIVKLENKVYVKGNSTLTIQPGVIIRGDLATQGTLIITKGSKIMASGTKTNPIVFTSNEAAGTRAEGDWGGLVILGKGINNQPGGIANIEGITASADTEYGGTDNADNSGMLQYVRIEFCGIALTPGKEINGLTMGSVGSGTTIDHIQVSYSGDDSFEWFGGAVDCKYLIAFAGVDDDFDTDFGYVGRIQFGLIIRDETLSDAAGDSNSFESDNDATGSNALPRTDPVFSNITIFGPKRDGSVTLPVGEKFEKSFRLRRNTSTSVHNSITTGWEKGLSIEGSSTEDNFTGDSAYFKNNILTNYAVNTAKVTATASFYNTFFSADGNDTVKTIASVNWVNAFPATINTTGDFRLNTTTTATNSSFAGVNFTGGFLGIEDPATMELTNMLVYPNPSNNNVTVKFNLNNNSTVSISIVDLAGKVVYSSTNNHFEGINSENVNVSNFINGIYFVKLTTGAYTSTVKFVKN